MSSKRGCLQRTTAASGAKAGPALGRPRSDLTKAELRLSLQLTLTRSRPAPPPPLVMTDSDSQLVYGLFVQTADLVIASRIFCKLSSFRHALSKLQRQRALRSQTGSSSAVERVPVELWEMIEAELVDLELVPTRLGLLREESVCELCIEIEQWQVAQENIRRGTQRENDLPTDDDVNTAHEELDQHRIEQAANVNWINAAQEPRCEECDRKADTRGWFNQECDDTLSGDVRLPPLRFCGELSCGLRLWRSFAGVPRAARELRTASAFASDRPQRYGVRPGEGVAHYRSLCRRQGVPRRG